MDEEYIPELGQALFGQPYKEYEASRLLIAALEAISYRLEIALGNVYADREPWQRMSPFDNSGTSFKCDIFEVESYSWDEDYDQPYNFKYKDIEVSWYKYLGRGTSVNREVEPNEISEMLNDCLNAIDKWEKENNKDGEWDF